MPSIYRVLGTQRKIRVIMVVVTDVAGVPTVSGEGSSEISSVTDNGAGDFTLNFAEAFLRAPQALVTPRETDLHGFQGTSAVGSIQINLEDLAAAAKDGDCNVLIWGYDTADRI